MMGKNYEVTLGSAVSSTAIFDVVVLQIYKGIPELKSIQNNDFGENITGYIDCMMLSATNKCEMELVNGSD